MKDARSFVSQRVPDALRRRLVDEEVSGVGLGIGIPREHTNIVSSGFPEHSRDRLLVFDADCDRIYTPGDPRLDNFILLGWIVTRRSRG